MKKILPVIICYALLTNGLRAQGVYHEQYRPQLHFSPKEKWTNDPNGMVYYKGIYHLFFQYYPKDIVWGPMHWGHATSTDLIHWQQQPIALYPDSLGYIFSGSAVVDEHNTSGFGKNGRAPLVAIFTHHDPKGEKEGTNHFQNQSLAYSLDDGKTWTKYADNPVLKNPGIKDFRDPKVMWYAPQKKWLMTLATLDHITFFSSPDLKTWTRESEFGKQLGAHGGVWECPDLFPMQLNGKTHWVLIVNVNPGGPNGGSSTQYFVGQFNGRTFTPVDNATRWLDYGPDEYAGITWSNTGSRHIFLGWMSNWNYANQVPTKTWRNAMNIPRELLLKEENGKLLVASEPVKELAAIELKPDIVSAESNAKNVLTPAAKHTGQYLLKFNTENAGDYALTWSNDAGQKLVIGYEKTGNRYYIDRSKSGDVSFSRDFAKPAYSPRFSSAQNSAVTLVVDVSSIELFANDGLNVMSTLFFPSKPYNHLSIQNKNGTVIKKLTITPLKSIW